MIPRWVALLCGFIAGAGLALAVGITLILGLASNSLAGHRSRVEQAVAAMGRKAER